MRNWLKHAWGFVRGLPRDTSTYLHRIISAVIGWATNIFHIVGSAWDELAKAYHDLSHTVTRFMDSAFAQIAKIVTHTIPTLARHLAHEISAVASDVKDLAKTVVHWVDSAVKQAEHLVANALKWVRDNVLDPLSKDIRGALHWIENTGNQLWHLVHDGEYIAALVFKWIWSQLLTLLKTYLATLLKWFIGNGVSFGTSLARIIEDAITEVL